MKTIETLVNLIKTNAQLYYEGNPKISDAEFDSYVDQLEKLDPNNPVLKLVGYGFNPVTDTLEVRPHRYDVLKFESKVRNASLINIPTSRRIASAKIDGGSILLYYTNGKLDYAITRGDGEKGFDVTDKFKCIVPYELDDNSFTGMVRGEVAMKLEVFNAKYANDYASPRNLAVGMSKRINITAQELLDLSFVAYTVRGNSDMFNLDSKSKVFQWLNINGFECVDKMIPDDWTDEKLGEIIKSYTKYAIDGIVITDEDYIQLEDGTFVPNTEVAYKTQSDVATVTVTDVEWNLTRTGKLYPTVWFTPVELSGAVIQKATAFNYEFVVSEGIGKGAEIVIQRSGEIIPDIVSVLVKSDNMDIPKICYECGHELTIEGVHLVCNNHNCKGKNRYNVIHWINSLIDIKGLGGTSINWFIDLFKINTVSDLYTKVDDTKLTANNFGTVTSTLIKEMMNQLRSPINMFDFMVACNLQGVGHSAASALINEYDLIIKHELNEEFKLKINNLKGVNRTGKASIINNIERIRKNAQYVAFELDTKIEEPIKIIENQTYAITGTLSVKRSEFVSELKAVGWSEVNIKKAKYLITDNPNSGSSKCKQAKQLGIEIISEVDFRSKFM